MPKPTGKRPPLSRLMIALGLVLLAAALAMEAAHYPWGGLFASVPGPPPDPDPIVLRAGDADSALILGAPEQGAAEATEEEEGAILPGDESEAAPAPVYYQLGVLKIPVLGVSQYVLEGTDRQLNYGVGHVVGTAALGQAGNCAVAGHRYSAFRHLDKLAEGDTVTLRLEEALFTYTVYASFDVLPDETWVLDDIPGETATLTLITCTPYLVSSHRMIVRARLTDTVTDASASALPAAPSPDSGT